MEREVIDLEARRQGIGGSDVAAILGMSPYKTALDIYYEKIGETPIIDEPDLTSSLGQLMEPVISARYEQRMGRKVGRSLFMKHPQHNFMLANLDGIDSEDDLTEFKFAFSYAGWGADGTNEIKERHLPQVHHYLAVANKKAINIGAAFVDKAIFGLGNQFIELCKKFEQFEGGLEAIWPILDGLIKEFRIYRVERSEKIIENLIEQEHYFWHENVLKRNPPDKLARAVEASENQAIEADLEIYSKIEELKETKELIKQASAIKEELEEYIKHFMGQANSLVFRNRFLAFNKICKGAQRFDAFKFKKDHPDLYEKYVYKSDDYSRFEIK